MLYAVIMAGGRGERFWPYSRTSRPKQMLKLVGKLTLIEETVERLRGLVEPANILIVTNQDYAGAIRKMLPILPAGNIVGEPVGRDTGPCVALATALVRARGGDDATILMLPADHVIHDIPSFHRVLADTVNYADRNPETLLTVGITPTFGSTAYGYIETDSCELPDFPGATKFCRVRRFCEKPDEATAESFVKAGNFKWNSGMFVWKVSAVRRAFARHCPDLAANEEQFHRIAASGRIAEELPAAYANCRKISIDYALMEKAEDIVMAESEFDWDDVGSWTAMRNQLGTDTEGNVITGKFAGVDVHNSIVMGNDNHLIAMIDVDNLVVVHTTDVTLIASEKSGGRIKELIKILAADPKFQEHL